jgi:adenosylcobinamide-GDP ribazoletransferase
MNATPIRSFAIAWHFLTIVRISKSVHEATREEMASSWLWFPLVGLCLGGLLVAIDRGGTFFLPKLVLDVLLVAVLITVTGALHQDGLADTLDGLGGGRTPAERLSIMRDPHLGAIGAVGLVLDLALRVVGFHTVPDDVRPHVLVCMPMLGRWGMIVGAWRAVYARPEGGLAAPFLAHLSGRQVLGATAFTAAVAVWQLGWPAALMACGLTVLVARGVTYGAGRFIGGITGDILGAINEFVEIAFLLLPWRTDR